MSDSEYARSPSPVASGSKLQVPYRPPGFTVSENATKKLPEATLLYA
ncbi:uncharacterized protein FFNC_15494 [Fusarium fujikuroi]|nr:uncharacterized protein FFNC_15494 [Fusarium fujikuroi]